MLAVSISSCSSVVLELLLIDFSFNSDPYSATAGSAQADPDQGQTEA